MRELHAPDGKFYTQAATVPAKERIFATAVYLGKYDHAENWRLADTAEKEAVEAEAAANAPQHE